MSIPKIIHYCWFGNGSFSEKEKRCIASWKRYCPDYEIKRWDETNFDVTKSTFTQNAYEKGKWAFVSDYARLEVIYNYGGIYLDTDVELIRPIDDLLQLKGFVGRECENFTINPGLGFGAEKRLPIIGEFFDIYKRCVFGCEDQKYEIVPIPLVVTEYMSKKNVGFVVANEYQVLDDLHIFPSEYFCPLNCYTGDIEITDKTYSIHHFLSSWKSDDEKKRFALYRKCVNVFGEKHGTQINILIQNLLDNGAKSTLKKAINRIGKQGKWQ